MHLPKYRLRKYLFAAGCALCILAALAIPLRGIWGIVTGSDPVAVKAT